MVLSAEDAAKFWPIYSEYDAQLTKLNDQRIENIREYARSYVEMTNEKADELVQKSLAYQKQRGELLAQTYDKVKEALGAITAASLRASRTSASVGYRFADRFFPSHC